MLLVVAALIAVVVDANRRRGADDSDIRAGVVSRTGLADLALSSSQRWVRHPSQVEFGAPFADGPLLLDPDPSGALVGPPVERR